MSHLAILFLLKVVRISSDR